MEIRNINELLINYLICVIVYLGGVLFTVAVFFRIFFSKEMKKNIILHLIL